MGIYYDDPGNLVDAAHFRCCAGFLILDSTPAGQKRALIEHMRGRGFLVKDMPRTRSVHGAFPYKVSMVSYPLGASRFYPASLAFMSRDMQRYRYMFEAPRPGQQEESGSIELTQGNSINYHFPLEQRGAFMLTNYPTPAWRNPKKYVDIMD